MNNQLELLAQRTLLKSIIKSTIEQIKAIQKNKVNAYSKEDDSYFAAQESILIEQKIMFEKMSKNLKDRINGLI